MRPSEDNHVFATGPGNRHVVPVFRIDLDCDPANLWRDRLLSIAFAALSAATCAAYATGLLSSLFLATLLVVLWRLTTERCRPLPHRWDATVDCFLDHIRGIGRVWKAAIIRTSYGQTGVLCFVVAAYLLTALVHLGIVRHSRELLALARRARTPVGDLVVMQYVYEACACCTAVVYTDQAGECWHARSMDWEMPFELRPVTFVVEAFRHGTHVFTATTWPAYVGVLTGMRMDAAPPARRRGDSHRRLSTGGAYSLSTNFRLGGQGYRYNFLMFLAGGWTIGNLLRHALERDDSFEAAERRLTRSWLIAPAFITLASGRGAHATQITRERMRALHPLRLKHDGAEAGGRSRTVGGAANSSSVEAPPGDDNVTWGRDHHGNVVLHDACIQTQTACIAQANIDHWQRFPDFMSSLARRTLATTIVAAGSTQGRGLRGRGRRREPVQGREQDREQDREEEREQEREPGAQEQDKEEQDGPELRRAEDGWQQPRQRRRQQQQQHVDVRNHGMETQQQHCGDDDDGDGVEGTEEADVRDAWSLLQRRPIFNAKTIYACVMCPSRGLYICRRSPDVVHEASTAAVPALERLAL
jgi:hypothetical protein